MAKIKVVSSSAFQKASDQLRPVLGNKILADRKSNSHLVGVEQT